MLDTEINSLHGLLIIAVVEYWHGKVLFEQNDSIIRDRLSEYLLEKIHVEISGIEWDEDVLLIEKGCAGATIIFVDENGKEKRVDFETAITKTLVHER